MLEILRNLINQIVNVIHKLFFIEIEITPNFKAPLGMMLISFAFICILVACVFHALGINFGQGDDD